MSSNNTEYQYINRSIQINNEKVDFVYQLEMLNSAPFEHYQININMSCVFPSFKEFQDFINKLHIHEHQVLSIKILDDINCYAEVLIFCRRYKVEVREDCSIDVNFEFETIEKSPYEKYDNKYPHICYNCKKSLKFGEMLSANRKYTFEQLKKIWKDKRIKLYCCNCYRDVEEEVLNG